jgi:anaerobic selenocysteine-containing dehydrogenase
MSEHTAKTNNMEIKRTVCPLDCPDTCSILATIEEGRVVSLQGDPDHPFTRGYLCGKMSRYPERVYSPQRILHPLKRTGPKGAGEFARITWDEALDAVAERFGSIMREHGAEAILPYSYGGTLGIVQRNAGHRFFHRLGASRLLRTICSPAATQGYNYTVGASLGPDPESIVHSDLIVIWGQNTSVVNLHLMPFIKEARQKGAPLIVIDPYRNETAQLADTHLQPIPGTDAALALGMMHVLIAENLTDDDYIDRYTTGYAQLRERVLHEHSPEWAARITGLTADAIASLARSYGRARAPFIRIGDGLSRHTNGGMAVRTIACLPGLVGAFAKTGGGALQSTGGAFPLNEDYIRRPDVSPSTRELNMVQLGTHLTSRSLNPPILALYVYHSNPAAVAPNQGLVHAGLRRDDLFTVVHEQVHTDTVDFADIVLPATTFLEHGDLYKSYGHLYMQKADPAISPVGEAKSNLEVFQLLAARLGLATPLLTEPLEAQIRGALDVPSRGKTAMAYEQIADANPHRVTPPQMPANGFPTPSGKLEFYSETMLGAGLDPLPGYEPCCHEESEAGGDALHLIAPPSKHFLNSTFGAVPSLVAKAGRPSALIHPQEAARRRIHDGELIELSNRRGSCRLYARVSDAAPPGVIVAGSVWWPKHSPERKGINQLTSDKTTDMAGGSTFHCNLVYVSPAGADGL